MHKLLKTMLFWMLLLAVPLQAFALAGNPECESVPAGATQRAHHAQPCEAAGQKSDHGTQNGATHAAGGACAACCAAVAPALVQFHAIPAVDALREPIAYTPAYLPRIIPEPPEHPPRILFI